MLPRGHSGLHRVAVVALLLSAALSPWPATPVADASGGSFGGGDGSPGNPYVIEDVLDLQNMSADLDACYVLGNDIDASATAGWNSGEGFEPVGTDEGGFTGSLEGGNHTITGLHIDRPDRYGVGLLGHVDRGGRVANVGLVDAAVVGYGYVGTLVGRVVSGGVDGCRATGTVAGTDDVGGLVGRLSDGTVSDCRAAVHASGSWDTGGLVGLNEDEVSRCRADGRVEGARLNTGGLAGSNSGNLTDCHATGEVTGAGWYVGGLAGFNLGMVSNCSAAGRVVGTSFVGGLAGHSWQYTRQCSVSDSLATGDVRGTAYVGGLLGYGSCPVSNCSATGEVATNGSFAGGLVGYNELHGVSGCSATGNVTGGGDVGGLVGFNEFGTVDSSWATGAVTAWDTAGGLVGFHAGTITRCLAGGDVSCNDGAGGLVGSNIGDISMSCASGAVMGGNRTGGFAGVSVWGIVSDSYSTGDVTGTDAVGGFVGHANESTVTRSYSAGAVTGTVDPGGFVGHANGSTVSACFWDTTTSGQDSSAGGAGRTTPDMMTQVTFTDAGWDFSRVWFMLENVTYPLLRWQDTAPPVAVAGGDVTVDQGAEVVLDGSGSSDDVGIAGWEWTLHYGGDNITLAGETVPFTFDLAGVYDVNLTVTDILGKLGYDLLTVTVLDTEPPVPSIGADIEVGLGEEVALDASGSTDNVGIASYLWSFVYNGTTQDLTGSTFRLTFHVPGVYPVALTLSDAAGNQATDHVVVTVVDVTPPVAVAEDRTVSLGVGFLLDAWSSHDDDPDLLVTGTARWTMDVDGSATPLEGFTAGYEFGEIGNFTCRLEVEDAAGNVGSTTFLVTVVDDTAPTAEAGPNVEVHVGEVVTLDGSGSADDYRIAGYTWTVPTTPIVVLHGVEVTHVFEEAGTWVVVLLVEDTFGNTASDALTVTVLPRRPVLQLESPQAGDRVSGRLRVRGAVVSDMEEFTVQYRLATVWGATPAWTELTSGPSLGFDVDLGSAGKGERVLEVRVWDGYSWSDVTSVPVTVQEMKDSGETTWYIVAGVVVVVLVIALVVLMMRRGKEQRGR